MVKIQEKNGKEGQTSIDFLTGMTLFILTLLFALNFMFGMVQPYSSTAEDATQLSDRASETLMSDVLTTPKNLPRQLDYNKFSEFFENTSQNEIKQELGLSEVDRYNITVSSAYTNYGTLDGITAYWPLNERRSQEASDVSGGTRYHGEVEGNVTTDVRGISSTGAYRFNGPGAAVNVSNDTGLNPVPDTGNMTLMAWVKTESGVAQPDENDTIVSKGEDEAYQIHLDDGEPTFETFGPGSDGKAQWGTTLDDGKWYHIAGVYNTTASDEVKLYVNGKLRDSDDGSVGTAGGDNLGIGKNLQSTDSDDRFFGGVIDEVRLYDRPLEPSEISKIHAKASILSPDKAKFGDPLENTTYAIGEEVPSGQDIASVSSRKRFGYIGKPRESEDSTSGGGANGNRVEFVAVSDNSQGKIRIEYGSGVDTGIIEKECLDAPNGDGSVDNNEAPCPGVITIGIDGDGDGTIDPGRDASDDVECCPNPSNGNDGVKPSDGNTTITIETSGSYNIDAGETLIVEFPKIHDGCKSVDARANGDGNLKPTQSCPAGSSSDSEPNIRTVEVTVRTW